MDPTRPRSATAVTVARLESRIVALEAALQRRSRELRAIQQHVCARDLALIGRIQAGLPPLPPASCDPLFWRETTDMTAADVDEVLPALWASLTPPPSDGPDGA